MGRRVVRPVEFVEIACRSITTIYYLTDIAVSI